MFLAHLQYAFLAERNGGSGMQWSNLSDPKNGMVQVWWVFAIEIVGLQIGAYYMEQVRCSCIHCWLEM